MALPLAEFEDVADMTPVPIDQMSRVERLIDKASALLRRALPQVDDRISLFYGDPTDRLALDPIVVATVVATVVKRFLDNTTGALNKTVTTGPYSTSVGYGERTGGAYVQRGTLVVTDEDLQKLLPDVPTGVGSIRVTPGWRAADCASRTFDSE